MDTLFAKDGRVKEVCVFSFVCSITYVWDNTYYPFPTHFQQHICMTEVKRYKNEGDTAIFR